MQACSWSGLVFGGGLVVAFSFGGCGGQPGPGGATPNQAPSSEMPKAGTPGEPAGESGETGDTGDEPKFEGEDTASDEGRVVERTDKETRTTEVIQKVVADNRKPVRECYDKARKDLPTLAGTMTIHFTLDPEGVVKKAELSQERSELKAPAVVNCAIAVIKKLKFPPSSRGMETTVNYPFNFKP